MKKIFLFAAVTAVALSSCSKDEVTSTSMENQAIGFGVYSGISTKGSETTSLSVGDATSGGLGILAYYQDGTTTAPTSFDSSVTPNFMYNQKVIGNGVATGDSAKTASAWSYDPVKYWPNDANDRISFFAYAPYDDQSGTPYTALSANNATATPTIAFTINPTASSMVDLVAGQTMLASYATNSGTVSLSLRHQLSRVTFSAITNVTSTTNSADDTYVVVKDMKITGAASDNTSPGFIKSNTYTFDTTTSNSTVDVSSTGGAAGNGTWGTATAYAADYSLSSVLALVEKTGSDCLGYEDSKVTGYGTAGVYVQSGKTTSTSLFTADQYLFLIPPTTTGIATAGTSDVEVSITYDIVSVDSKLAAGYIATSNTVTFDLTDGTLIQGKAYNYILTIGLNAVTVSAEVVAWDEDQTTADGGSGDDYTVK